MGDAPEMTPKELVLLSVPPGLLRLTRLKTFVASPRNWNLHPLIDVEVPEERRIDVFISRPIQRVVPNQPIEARGTAARRTTRRYYSAVSGSVEPLGRSG